MNILAIIHARKWSWTLVLDGITKRLKHHKIAKHTWNPNINIDTDILDFFDIVLTQNVDEMKQVRLSEKVICRIGGFYMDREHHPENRFDEELSKVGAIIATNDRLYQVGKRVNPNTFMIPNGVDLDVFRPLCTTQSITRKKFTVGFAGNIQGGSSMNYKGWRYYVEATNRLRPLIDTFNALYDHKQIDHDKMPTEFFSKIDCLVLPSVGEGSSNIVMEALACGVPVLLTKVGFHGERLQHGINCLFIKRDVNDIMTKIKMLINDPILCGQLTLNGRIFAEVNHDINDIAAEYDDIFKLILDKKGN